MPLPSVLLLAFFFFYYSFHFKTGTCLFQEFFFNFQIAYALYIGTVFHKDVFCKYMRSSQKLLKEYPCAEDPSTLLYDPPCKHTCSSHGRRWSYHPLLAQSP